MVAVLVNNLSEIIAISAAFGGGFFLGRKTKRSKAQIP